MCVALSKYYPPPPTPPHQERATRREGRGRGASVPINIHSGTRNLYTKVYMIQAAQARLKFLDTSHFERYCLSPFKVNLDGFMDGFLWILATEGAITT